MTKDKLKALAYKLLFAVLLLFATAAQAQFADQRQYAPTSTGTANAQIVAIPNYALNVGVGIRFRAGLTNTSAMTLVINGQPAKPVLRLTGSGLGALIGSEVLSGQISTVVYDGTQYELLSTNYLTVGANTVLGNFTNSAVGVGAFAMPSCPDTASNHLSYITGTGIICGTAEGAAAAGSLTGTTLASNVVNSSLTAFGASPTLASPTFTGTVAGANTIPLSILAQVGANTMNSNWTSGTANVTANTMPSCADSTGSHLNYVNGTGVTCGTTTGAAAAGTLTGTTLAAGVVTSSLTTVGTIGTGTWQGSILAGTYGGSGINNGANTLTFPSGAHTSAAIDVANTFTANQTISVASAAQLTVKSTGINNGFINIDNAAGSQQSGFTLLDAAAAKFQVFKDTDNSFKVFDAANSAFPIIVSNAGALTIGEAAQITMTKTGLPQVGTAGSVVGSWAFANATSGTVSLQPPTGALGSAVVTLPGVTTTLATTNTNQTFTSKTINSPTIGVTYTLTALAWSATAPVATTFCATSPSIPNNNGTAAFTINVGTSCSTSVGTITMSPAAATGWVCSFADVTTPASNVVSQTGGTTTTVTVTNYARTTGIASNWTASEVIRAMCSAY